MLLNYAVCLFCVSAAPPALAAPSVRPAQIVLAEGVCDMATLLRGPFQAADLPRVALALGRCGGRDALDRLALFAQQSSDAHLQLAAIEAMSWVADSAPVLRALVPELSTNDARAAAIRALGFVGDATDLALLLSLSARPVPEGPAALGAVGQLHERGVDITSARPAIISACLHGPRDSRLLAAWLLSELGLQQPVEPVINSLLDAWRASAIAEERVWLLNGLWPALDGPTRQLLAAEIASAPFPTVQRRLAELQAAPPSASTPQPPAGVATAFPSSSPALVSPEPSLPQVRPDPSFLHDEFEVLEVLRMRSARVQTTAGELILALEPERAPYAVAALAAAFERGTMSAARLRRGADSAVVIDAAGAPGVIPAEPTLAPILAGTVALDPHTGVWCIFTQRSPSDRGSFSVVGRVVRGLDVLRRLTPADRVTGAAVETGLARSLP